MKFNLPVHVNRIEYSNSPMRLPEVLTRLVIEFGGTALIATLAYFGLAQAVSGVGNLLVAAIFSFAYSIALIGFKGDYATGFNPAVTLGSLLAPGSSSFDIISFLVFALCQFAGALTGSAIGRGLYLPYDEISDPFAGLIAIYRMDTDKSIVFLIHFALESLATAGVVLMFLRYTHMPGNVPMLAPIYVGAVYFVAVTVFRVFILPAAATASMGISMNPAVVFSTLLTRPKGVFSHADTAYALLFLWACHLTGSIGGAILWRITTEETGLSKLPPFRRRHVNSDVTSEKTRSTNSDL